MAAKSKTQQRLFGMARGIQKGELSPDVSGKAAKIAEEVSRESVKDFAKTKHRSLKNRLMKRNINTPRKRRG
jgi:hypothetical protein